MVVWFFAAQILVSFLIITIKALTDTDWLYLVAECLETEGVFSSTYLGLLCQVLTPALIAADFIIMAPLFIKAVKKKEKIIRTVQPKNILYLISLGIGLNFIVSAVVDMIPSGLTGNYDSLMGCAMAGSPIIVMLATGILAPITEELIFRYGICRFFEEKKKAIFISALLFGIAHMNLIQGSYAFVIGLVLAWLYTETGNLLVPIIVHVTVNAGSVLYEYFPEIPISAVMTIVAACYIAVYTLKSGTFQSQKHKEETVCVH